MTLKQDEKAQQADLKKKNSIEIEQLEHALHNNKDDWDTIVAEAQDATNEEHELTTLQALKLYPRACFWSFIISMTVVMEGYDLQLIGALFALPAFQQHYGEHFGDSVGYQISTKWQTSLKMGNTVGSFIGILITGFLSERFGYKKTILGALVMMIGAIFATFFAPSLEVLLAGEILCGLPWGTFSVLGPAYASEVSPVILRHYFTVYILLCWAMGQLICAGVMAAYSDVITEWAYRIPFAIQWIWPLPLLAIILFAPESPWWLVRNGKYTEANNALKKLTNPSRHSRNKHTIAMMIHTNQTELEEKEGTSFLDCFRGSNLRRTEISCVAFSIQVIGGNGMCGNAVYFFEQAGLDSSLSYDFALGTAALAMVGGLLSWGVAARYGRRSILFYGLIMQCIIMLIIGCVSLAPSSNSSASWVQASFVMIWMFVYYMTVSPITFVIIAETSTTRLRAKTVGIARNAYLIATVVNNIMLPRMLNPSSWDWQGKTGFFFFGTTVFLIIWTFFRMPETKGRTYAELDILFKNRISARKFSKTNVDAFASDTENATTEQKQ